MLKQIGIWLDEDCINWIAVQPRSVKISALIRELLKKYIQQATAQQVHKDERSK